MLDWKEISSIVAVLAGVFTATRWVVNTARDALIATIKAHASGTTVIKNIEATEDLQRKVEALKEELKRELEKLQDQQIATKVALGELSGELRASMEGIRKDFEGLSKSTNAWIHDVQVVRGK